MTASLLKKPQFVSKTRRSAIDSNPAVLADIYNEDVNIAVWQRTLSPDVLMVVNQLLAANPEFKLSVNIDPRELPNHLFRHINSLKIDNSQVYLLVEDIINIVSMYCCLFDLQNVGLRLTALDKAMCPKFHVDRIPARLVTTFQGTATEWLPHECVDRNRLGAGGKGLADHESGIYLQDSDIQQLNAGDVAILKGEYWEGNEQAGLVHRSPAVNTGECRLLLTLDFVPTTLQ